MFLNQLIDPKIIKEKYNVEITKESLKNIHLLYIKGLVITFPLKIHKDVFIIDFAYNREAKLITN